MKSSDRSIFLGLVILGIGAAFWFLALAPKRERAGELEEQVATVSQEVSEQEAVAAAARTAQDQYEPNFSSLVTLGKAAPPSGDQPGLIEQVTSLSKKAGTNFEGLTLGGEGSGAAAPAAPTAPAPTTPAPESSEGEGDATATPVVAAAPTEATASSLPLGASVGPAGLGVMPYELTFSGDFFEISDLMESIDALVHSKKAEVGVRGRLLTVNSFAMAPGTEGSDLAVSLSVTSYVLPESQGLTAGGTTTEPPASVPSPTPVATPTEATP